jgi:two-component system, sensor histidine kinase ChiS
LENLVSNAIKYSPHGKKITIRVEYRDTFLHCSVQDEGPGLSEEDKLRLFQRFTRLSAQPTGGEHSSGLGLSIAKKLIEAMGGEIWCESELGHGAAFFVKFACAHTSEAASNMALSEEA